MWVILLQVEKKKIDIDRSNAHKDLEVKLDEKQSEVKNLHLEIEKLNISIKQIQEEKENEIEKLKQNISDQCRKNEEDVKARGKLFTY